MNGATAPFLNAPQFRWIEGPSALHPRAVALASRRPLLRERFYTAVLPDLALREARRRVQGIGARGGSSRALWSSWEVPGEARVLWALHASTRQVRGAIEGRAPANDGYVLAAWGDGPVIAWADDRPAVRAVLREALAALPEWLCDGVVSADATLPLRIVPTASPPSRSGSVRPTSDAAPEAWSGRGCAS